MKNTSFNVFVCFLLTVYTQCIKFDKVSSSGSGMRRFLVFCCYMGIIFKMNQTWTDHSFCQAMIKGWSLSSFHKES